MIEPSESALSPSSYIQRRDGLLVTAVAGTLVMMDADKGLYFELDPIGTAIWQRLEEPVGIAALVADLAAAYQAPAAEVERDVLALLHHMAEHGLITRC